MRKLQERLTYANVISTLALFVALGGGAYAAIDLVGKNDIKSRHIAPNAVKGKDAKESTFRGLNASFVNGKPAFSTGLVSIQQQASTSDPPTERTLFQTGPFTVFARCDRTDASSTMAQVVAQGPEPLHVVVNDTVFSDNNPPYAVSLAVGIDPSGPGDNREFLLYTSSGRSLQGLATARAEAATGTCVSRTSLLGG